jgi:hypothetical protein
MGADVAAHRREMGKRHYQSAQAYFNQATAAFTF